MMRILLTVLALLTIAGCDGRNTYLVMFESRLADQFKNACNKNVACEDAVGTHMPACFESGLATQAAQTRNLKTKYDINKKHILKIESCLSKKSGQTYWKDIDMPGYILKPVGK